MSYDRERALALRLLTKKGKPVTLNREQDGATYDTVSGTFIGGSPLVLNGVGVLLNFNKFELAGDDVRTTDRKLLYQGDELLINDIYNDWRVYAINNLDPDESGTILTTAQLRK